jgi:GNAT superfamily N-acetyltransferase
VTLPAWREEPVARAHRRAEFDCGVPALNEYLARFARQNHDAGGAKTFVAVPADEPTRVLGYYSISPASIAYDRVPEAITRGLARYEVPAFRLGRLAVDRGVQGLGLGGQLLLAAGARTCAVAAQVGGVALTIDAKDERAAAWYQGYGAIPLLDDPRTLVLPLATVARAIGG